MINLLVIKKGGLANLKTFEYDARHGDCCYFQGKHYKKLSNYRGLTPLLISQCIERLSRKSVVASNREGDGK